MKPKHPWGVVNNGAGQPVGKRVARDAERPPELVESPYAVHAVAEDHQGPLVAHEVNRPGNGAGRLGMRSLAQAHAAQSTETESPDCTAFG